MKLVTKENHDSHGLLNYIIPFIDICEANLIHIENMAQCEHLGTKSIKPTIKM